MSDSSFRDLLRSIRSPKAELPQFDTDAAPDDPIALFLEWTASAVDAGVSQLNAMTLSTATAAGVPSARTLLLKDVTADGFWFASLASAPKGEELAQNPHAALTLYWREQGRQVRVSGSVAPGPRAVSEQDFLARHPLARAQAIAGEQSTTLPGVEEVAGLVASASELIAVDPLFVPMDWTAYVLEPTSVEFWQASGHDQIRLRYMLSPGGWTRELLWP
jgi:pyridoxamine 5'-phosphate oxidase